MPSHTVVVRSPQNNRGSNEEAYVYRKFNNLSLADRYAPGRSYAPGEHYVSSEPNGHLSRPAPPTYYGPHFKEKGPRQEEIWNERGSTTVWRPSDPLPPKKSKPREETFGRAHSIGENRRVRQLSVPYEKRPNPYPPRVNANYKLYKDPSGDERKAMRDIIKPATKVKVGQYYEPKEAGKKIIEAGIDAAMRGRTMGNMAAQTRVGFSQKYPQFYETFDAVESHRTPVTHENKSAENFRQKETIFRKGLRRGRGRNSVGLGSEYYRCIEGP
ncbi:hypothetical protein N7493_009535 [Penicillium malachiteum]|uniref:Uncharacterized protein n=1 Tax=Penicillium malachiteum TaxID=1324776 RepID=A0AAD6MSG3_9EURO|nr:hypothetical protein N7493_009535 [Penicillium malachiteum]